MAKFEHFGHMINACRICSGEPEIVVWSPGSKHEDWFVKVYCDICEMRRYEDVGDDMIIVRRIGGESFIFTRENAPELSAAVDVWNSFNPEDVSDA